MSAIEKRLVCLLYMETPLPERAWALNAPVAGEVSACVLKAVRTAGSYEECVSVNMVRGLRLRNRC